MTKRLLVLIAATVLACGRAPERAAGTHGDGAAGAGEAAHGEANVLAVDPSMLRDLKLTTAPAERRRGAEGVTVAGEIASDPERTAEVGAAVTARVVRVLAAPGDVVRAGQPLAEARSAELGRARSERASSAARADAARSALERKRALAERIVPRREVEEAEAAFASAQADLDAADAALEALAGPSARRGEGSLLVLVSPVAGTVLSRDVALGRMLDAEHTAFRVADLSAVSLVAHVFERDAVRVVPGAAAKVALAAFPGRVFMGRVALVGREVESSSRTIPVRVALANPDGALRPGMSASARLDVTGTGKDVIAVPAAALQRVHEAWAVFLPKSEGVFEVRAVGRGRDLDGEVEILSGLAAGEAVVVDGAFLLKAEADKSEGAGGHHDH